MPKEASIIQRFRSGLLNEDADAIMDILTEYSGLQNQPGQMLTHYWKKLLK